MHMRVRCVYVYVYVYVSICLYVYMPICLYAYMSICLYVYMSICLYIYTYGVQGCGVLRMWCLIVVLSPSILVIHVTFADICYYQTPHPQTPYP